MPDDPNRIDNEAAKGTGPWDACIVFIEAVRDILNDWRVAVTLLIVALIWAGKVAGPDIADFAVRVIGAWKGQGP
jgi:hypothetical protein